ncbi:MAG: exosortase-associated EpsI family protein [Puniceicoccaceae bacterium]
MNERIKRWGFPVLVIVVLLSVAGIQFASYLTPVPESTLSEKLEDLIPESLVGWEVEDLDLGSTESVRERSHSLLKLDDFVHRSYRRGDRSFTVYVAYWEPGKMPVRLVNQHTPDRCWTEVGFTCTDREWNVERSVNGRELQPGQWGIYELNDYKHYTYFWHIVGGEVHWYGGNRINTRSSLSTVWEDFRKFGLNVHREQFFVRIVSPQPMDDLWEEEGFNTVISTLADLCLAKAAEPQPVAMR